MKSLCTACCLLALCCTPLRAQFAEITAKELLPNALSTAQSSVGTDSYLRNVFFVGMVQSGVTITVNSSTGKANAWVYHFYSPSLDSTFFLIGLKILMIPQVIPVPVGTVIPQLPIPNARQLSEPFIDSPEAFVAIMAAGGAAFLQSHPAGSCNLAMAVDNPDDLPLLPKGKYWVAHFIDGNDELYCMVNAETGQSAQCGQLNELRGIPAASGLRLDEAYPQPLTASGAALTLRFAVADPCEVTLSVHDVLGRRVATLEEGRIAAGEHVAALRRADFPAPGMYIVRLETGRGTLARRITVR